jgi:hypothetical protein
VGRQVGLLLPGPHVGGGVPSATGSTCAPMPFPGPPVLTQDEAARHIVNRIMRIRVFLMRTMLSGEEMFRNRETAWQNFRYLQQNNRLPVNFRTPNEFALNSSSKMGIGVSSGDTFFKLIFQSACHPCSHQTFRSSKRPAVETPRSAHELRRKSCHWNIEWVP